MLSVRILWAVKILLVLRKASAAGAPLMKGRELQAACIGPGADSYCTAGRCGSWSRRPIM